MEPRGALQRPHGVVDLALRDRFVRHEKRSGVIREVSQRRFGHASGFGQLPPLQLAGEA